MVVAACGLGGWVGERLLSLEWTVFIGQVKTLVWYLKSLSNTFHVPKVIRQHNYS